jgi:DNA invertase Pin-like site-specific DNA recombinase
MSGQERVWTGPALLRCSTTRVLAIRLPSSALIDSGRSLAELLVTVAMLKERGIALLSMEEKIDTSSAAGELVFHVFGAIAHFERRLISERTRDGVVAARAKGKRPGRRPLDQAKVDAAMTLIAANTAPTEAARQLGLGRSTIYREMRRLGISRPA